MKTSSRFWDKLAEKYARQPISDQAAYERKLTISRDYFDTETDILEIGCGTGSTALAHAPYARQIRALDFSQKMIEIATRKQVEAGIENVVFELGAAETLGIEPGSQQVVMAHSLLHLLEDRKAVMQQVFDLLKPGGVFISNTVCISDKMPFLRFILPLMQVIGKAPHVEIFRSRQLIEEMSQVGFEIDHEWRPGNGMTLFLVAKKPMVGSLPTH